MLHFYTDIYIDFISYVCYSVTVTEVETMKKTAISILSAVMVIGSVTSASAKTNCTYTDNYGYKVYSCTEGSKNALEFIKKFNVEEIIKDCQNKNNDINQDQTQKPDTDQTQKPENNNGNTVSNSEYETKVLGLVNNERAKNGLSALTLDSSLSTVARNHSYDMAKNNFFDHTNLSGQSPFDRLKAAGISYSSAGENIAAGQSTPQEVVNAWMNSSGHRANILNVNYTKMGVGYYNGGSRTHYWTQLFTS